MNNIIADSDADSVFDEGNISSAQQILHQGAGRQPYITRIFVIIVYLTYY